MVNVPEKPRSIIVNCGSNKVETLPHLDELNRLVLSANLTSAGCHVNNREASILERQHSISGQIQKEGRNFGAPIGYHDFGFATATACEGGIVTCSKCGKMYVNQE